MDVMKKPITKETRSLIAYTIGLLHTDLYFERYYQIIEPGKPDAAKEAFYSLEKELFDLCGVNRYNDYQTFRQIRYRKALKGQNRTNIRTR